MEKEFVPYGIALELKELGFDEECLGFYIWQSWNNNSRLEIGNDNEYTCETIKAPLYQQAFRFFREKYRLYYSIQIKDGIWFFEKWDLRVFKTYEEAELECLKKLIELAKM